MTPSGWRHVAGPFRNGDSRRMDRGRCPKGSKKSLCQPSRAFCNAEASIMAAPFSGAICPLLRGL
jgi:hypothetical protein